MDKEEYSKVSGKVKNILREAYPRSLTTKEIEKKCNCTCHGCMLRKLKILFLNEEWLMMDRKTNTYFWRYMGDDTICSP